MPSKPTTLYRITMAHCAYVLASSEREAYEEIPSLLSGEDALELESIFAVSPVSADDRCIEWGGDDAWVLSRKGEPYLTVGAFLKEHPNGTRGEDVEGKTAGQQGGKRGEEDPRGGARGEVASEEWWWRGEHLPG